MLQQLTPEQAFELFEYSALEPFGELRADLRMAHQMLQSYNFARGGKGEELSLGDFVLYRDVAESTRRARSDAALIMRLNQMARRGGRANGV